MRIYLRRSQESFLTVFKKMNCGKNKWFKQSPILLAICVFIIILLFISSLPVSYAQNTTFDDFKEFETDHLAAVNESKDLLTYQNLVQRFPEGEYASSIGYTLSETNYYNLVKEKMELTKPEEEKINENGFVVSSRLNYPSFGDAYIDFFYKDLPVFISTDSILQALHRSYDIILAEIEKNVLMDQLEHILSQAQAALPGIVTDSAGLLADTCHDVNIFYTVARKLLGRSTAPLPYSEDEKVKAFLSYIDQLSFEWVDIFGMRRKIDFSQFKPRGHYTKSKEFERYFQAMIWLGRIDFRIEAPRELLGAYLILRSIEEGKVRSAWEDMNKVIELLIGEPDAMNIETMTELMEEAEIQKPEDLLDEKIQNKVFQIMEERGYGVQRICSHYLKSNPLDPEPAPMPKAFAFMGQRFTVDSHVFSNVVFDRIVVEDEKVLRMMPDPLDAMFVLSNNRALHHLKDELNTWRYQGNLFILRYLVDKYDRGFWESNVYNSWLDALRSLSGPFEERAGYPATICTPAYQDKLLHTQLASWAELRHDTILYVKQSYTYYITCEYPDGYVEPVPEFYRRLKNFANRTKDILESITIPNYLKKGYSFYYEGFANTMQMLETMAQKQIDGKPRTDKETQFIKETIILKQYFDGCARITKYDGWYPRLFYSDFYSDTEECMEPDYIVADVHTNPNPPCPKVLHVGVGKINVIYFTAQTCAGPTLYVGPVFSYYENIVPGMIRLNDMEWAKLVNQGSLNPPEWTDTFLVR